MDFKQLRKYVVYPLLVVVGLGFLNLWLPNAFIGLSINRERMAAISPMMKKAKALGLTYKMVLEKPYSYEGEPVTWCVRNRGVQDVTVNGEENKPLTVSNHPAMPVYMGSKHQACTPMLLLVEKGAPGRPVPVYFKEAL